MREILGTANSVPNIIVIENTVNIIEEIGHQSLQVASLIDEYTKLGQLSNLFIISVFIKINLVLFDISAHCQNSRQLQISH